MTIYVIKRKQSNTDDVRDLSSTYDREIRFPEGHRYAVVLAACHIGGRGAHGHTTHHDCRSAIEQSTRLRGYGYAHRIIDSQGNWYDTPDGQVLVQV